MTRPAATALLGRAGDIADEARKASCAWPLVALLCVAHGLAFADRFLLAATAPLVARDLALGDALLGVLLGPAFAAVYGMGALAMVWVPVGAGRPRWLIAGLFLWTLGSAATGLAGSFAMLAIARAAVGLGQAMALPLALALLIDAAPEQARGRALSCFTSGAALGRAAAFLGAGVLLALVSGRFAGLAPWRLLYLIAALPNLLVLAALVLWQPPRPADGIRAPEAPLRAWLRAERRPVGGACLAAIASVAAVQAVVAWLPTLIVRQHGVSTAAAASLAGGVTLVASPAGQMLSGLLLDRVARLRAAPLSLLVAALGGAVAALGCAMAAGDVAAAGGALVLAILALGVATVAGLFAVQAAIPAALRRRGMTVFMALSTMAGAGVGPVLAGVGAASGALRGLGGALVATVAVCALIACGASRLARPSRSRSRSAWEPAR